MKVEIIFILDTSGSMAMVRSDAFRTGESLNIKADNTANYVASKAGISDAYRLMSNTVKGMRS